MIISVRMHECCEMSEVEVMSDKQTTLVLRVEQCWIVLQIESLTASIRQLEMERTQLYENLKEQRHLSDNLSVKVADLQEDVIRKCVCSLSLSISLFSLNLFSSSFLLLSTIQTSQTNSNILLFLLEFLYFSLCCLKHPD